MRGVDKLFQTVHEIFQKNRKITIIICVVCISIFFAVFSQSFFFFVNRLIAIATDYYRGHGGLIYLITIPILIILPIVYGLLYKNGFKITSIHFPENIRLRYLLLLHAVISFFALWRGGDKWVGPDLPVYYSLVNSIVEDFDSILWNLFNNPRSLDSYLIGEPVAFFLLAGMVAFGLPIHFISAISIAFSLINLSLTYKLLLRRFEEGTASTGALMYIFSAVIIRFEADLIRNLFAITFGLLALYFWERKKVLTPIFFALTLATHIATASLFFLSLLYLAREERSLQKFILTICIGFLLLLPLWLIVDPYTIYIISIRRIQIFFAAGTFFDTQDRRGGYPFWADAIIIPTLRIISSIGLFLVYYGLNYHKISKTHWSVWVIVTSLLIITGYIFPLFHPERWALYLGFALMFLIAPSLKPEDKTLFLVFLAVCLIAFVAHLKVAY